MDKDIEVAKKLIEAQRRTEVRLERLKKLTDINSKKTPPLSKKKKNFFPEIIHDDGPWIITFADMVTLLMLFFLLITVLSTISESNLKSVIEGISATFGKEQSKKIEELEDLNKVFNEINQIVEAQKLQTSIHMSIDNRGVVIRGSESIFFDSGKAEILPSGEKFLYEIYPVIERTNYNIQVEGHTDNDPIKTPFFPSNWELSAVRSTTVVRFFIEKCQAAPTRFSAMEFGEYRPLVPNTTPENKAKNRRIEIIILRTKYQ